MWSDPIIVSTAHDLFGGGLWTIDDDLRMSVAQSDLIESILPGGSHFKLSDLHDRRLSFSPQATLRPDPAHIAWHRREVFESAWRKPCQRPFMVGKRLLPVFITMTVVMNTWKVRALHRACDNLIQPRPLRARSADPSGV